MYWASNLILPKKVVKSLEQSFNNFLWCGHDSNKGVTKFARSAIRLPKKGGLGLKSIDVWSKASILKHIWNFFT